MDQKEKDIVRAYLIHKLEKIKEKETNRILRELNNRRMPVGEKKTLLKSSPEFQARMQELIREADRFDEIPLLDREEDWTRELLTFTLESSDYKNFRKMLEEKEKEEVENDQVDQA